MNRRLSTGDGANIYIHKVFSELFHGSGRAIIRLQESGLERAVGARAIACLKRDGLILDYQICGQITTFCSIPRPSTYSIGGGYGYGTMSG